MRPVSMCISASVSVSRLLLCWWCLAYDVIACVLIRVVCTGISPPPPPSPCPRLSPSPSHCSGMWS